MHSSQKHQNQQTEAKSQESRELEASSRDADYSIITQHTLYDVRKNNHARHACATEQHDRKDVGRGKEPPYRFFGYKAGRASPSTKNIEIVCKLTVYGVRGTIMLDILGVQARGGKNAYLNQYVLKTLAQGQIGAARILGCSNATPLGGETAA